MPLHQVFKSLLSEYGRQHWWPGDSPFEIMVGAVLTQNTAWTNVEKAIVNLVTAGCLDPQAIVGSGQQQLAQMLKPSGYFNVKAKRLMNCCRWYLENGEYNALRHWNTGALRNALLKINGVGPETADDIMLYAFNRPVFVIDAYTRRLFSRLRLVDGDASYEILRRVFETSLPKDAILFNEYHALIVRHAKQVCRIKPLCTDCCLMERCV